jgi:16S rRNA (uracil1498-N3)-methyltransferase
LQPQPQSVSLAVGPEGGWATDDLNRFISEGFQVVTLGGRILRAETVPIVALAMLVCLWDDS